MGFFLRRSFVDSQYSVVEDIILLRVVLILDMNDDWEAFSDWESSSTLFEVVAVTALVAMAITEVVIIIVIRTTVSQVFWLHATIVSGHCNDLISNFYILCEYIHTLNCLQKQIVHNYVNQVYLVKWKLLQAKRQNSE